MKTRFVRSDPHHECSTGYRDARLVRRNSSTSLPSGPLLAWYQTNKRDLPWRRKPDLYRTLVSEFMLQQTRIDQALPYFRRFMKSFPSMSRLAAAPIDEVIRHWEGLGYYARARNLHGTAQRLARKRTITLEYLNDCPGIGPYTLAAIASIVWGEPLPVVDGNVNRVVARYLALRELPASTSGKKIIRRFVEASIDRAAPGDWNQAVMELGATVCLPRQPLCSDCPLKDSCQAHRDGSEEDYPLRPVKATRPHRPQTATVIRDGKGRWLIAQRPSKGMLANLWEFPSGDQNKNESIRSACSRNAQEKLGLEISVGKKLACIEHGFSHFTISLHFYAGEIQGGRPHTKYYQCIRWVRTGELAHFPFPRAHWPVLEQLGVPMNEIRQRTSP